MDRTSLEAKLADWQKHLEEWHSAFTQAQQLLAQAQQQINIHDGGIQVMRELLASLDTEEKKTADGEKP